MTFHVHRVAVSLAVATVVIVVAWGAMNWSRFGPGDWINVSDRDAVEESAAKARGISKDELIKLSQQACASRKSANPTDKEIFDYMTCAAEIRWPDQLMQPVWQKAMWTWAVEVVVSILSAVVGVLAIYYFLIFGVWRGTRAWWRWIQG
jgi:hypothetical protein